MDSSKFLCNPEDLDGQTPTASTFVPGNYRAAFEKKDGTVQVAYIDFLITEAEYVSDSYWEIKGEPSQDFGAADNIMVVNFQPPNKDDEQDARLDELESKLFNGEYKYKTGTNPADTAVIKIVKMDGDRLYTQINPTDLNGQELDMKFFVEGAPTSWIIDGVRYNFERGSYNLSANYLTANVWTADGGLDGFEVPANGAEVIVNTPAEPFDIAKYATIEYSDGKDEGLSLRIDSLEQLTTGNQADLGGASWTCDDEVRESHFRRGRTIK